MNKLPKAPSRAKDKSSLQKYDLTKRGLVFPRFLQMFIIYPQNVVLMAANQQNSHLGSQTLSDPMRGKCSKQS